MHYTPIVGSGGQWLASMYDSQNAPSALLQARKDLWNGNILTQDRWDEMGVLFEDLEYQYNWLNDELIQNRLYHVNDLIAGSPQEGDIEDQGTFYDAQNQIKTNNNYLYTAIGELQVDKSEDIEEIIWRVDSKIAEVRRTSNSTKKNLRFDYDAMGNRIAKHIYTDNAFTLLEKSTYYVRDASGNVMAVYDRIIDASVETGEFMLSERHIYGSSRIGMDVSTHVFGPDPYTALTETTRELGHKQYEISNHLGNVMVVVSDRKLAVDDGTYSGGVKINSTPDGITDFYQADVLQAVDRYCGGLPMPGRSFYSSSKYRYGAGGHEILEEVSVGENNIDMGDRWTDLRILRTYKPDAKGAMFPGVSPYSYLMNSFPNAVDPDGKVVIFVNGLWGAPTYASGGGTSAHWGKDWNNNGIPWATSAMNAIGDHRARFYDGSADWRYKKGGTSRLSWNFDYRNRMQAGYMKGKTDAADIVNGLERDAQGNITESIKFVTSSMGTAFARGMSNAIMAYVAGENKKIDAYNATLEKNADGTYKDASLVKQHLNVQIEFTVDLDAFQGASVGADQNAQDNYHMKTESSWAGGKIFGSKFLGLMKGHHPSYAPTENLPKGKMNPKGRSSKENPTE